MKEKRTAGEHATRWHPAWVRTLGAPVWITDPAGEISYINARAEDLIGRPAEELIGRQCHELIAGQTRAAGAFCSADCPVRRLASRGREISPFPLRITGAIDATRNVRVIVIATQRRQHERPHLVHCVVNDDRDDRLHGYLDSVASRSHPSTAPTPPGRSGLTSRENEILELLARDKTLREIANELFLSYATVRNHTQHILAKMGVHSILEAIAFYLLNEE